MRSLLLHWLLNAAALWVAAWLLPGLDFTGTLVQLFLVAAVFGIVNSLVRPILTVLTCPLIVITLGLFTLVINALMLLLTGALSERWGLGFSVGGFWPAFFGGLVVGIVSMVLSLALPGKREEG
jgi:putative membrane protein